ncbi:MAG TPA: patatin-like phospholipase family protein [Nevskiaceae bacterium]
MADDSLPRHHPSARFRARSAGDALTPAAAARSYQSVALVLQGGGALGAYQCGVYEGLHAAGLRPDWFVGTSIGAINAAIMAGNEPERRVERLHEFWDLICEPVGLAGTMASAIRTMLSLSPRNPLLDGWANSMGALGALVFGQRGYFHTRPQSPFLLGGGAPAATSFYDTTPLRSTLERLVDFDRINARRGVRLSVGAAQIETGNSHYFDSSRETIGPEHVMASAALPPAFPAVEIDGFHYWDGGIVSNTPLECVWNDDPRRDSLVLQVDLWSARGTRPATMMDVFERQKDIQYSSRTRLVTDYGATLQKLRLEIADALAQLPEGALDPKLRKALLPWTCSHVFNIVHLIYQSKPYEAQFKDYAFGLGTQRQHWADGLADMQHTLEHPDFFARPSHEAGVVTHDVHRTMAQRAKRTES